MVSWFIKMFLKLLKPLAKFAIACGLLDAVLGGLDLGEETEEEPAEGETPETEE